MNRQLMSKIDAIAVGEALTEEEGKPMDAVEYVGAEDREEEAKEANNLIKIISEQNGTKDRTIIAIFLQGGHCEVASVCQLHPFNGRDDGFINFVIIVW